MPSVQVQHLPPSDYYRYEPPHYDDHQFQNSRRSRQKLLAFADLHNMHFERRKQTQERRLATPGWALNDEQLRELLVQYLERQAFFGRVPPGTMTLEERIKRAEEKLAVQVPKLQSELRQRIFEYHELQKCGRLTPSRRKELEREIQGIDTRICIIRRGALATLTAMVYLYYREGLNAVDVAEQLGVVPTTVHQVFYKLAKLSKRSEDQVRREPRRDPYKCKRGHLRSKYTGAGGHCIACHRVYRERAAAKRVKAS